MTVFNHHIHLKKTAAGSVFNMIIRGKLSKQDYPTWNGRSRMPAKSVF
jgi:hypothetical protein